jgi:hypothetical protein
MVAGRALAQPAAVFSGLIGAFLTYGFATGTGWWAFVPAGGALTAAAACAVGSWPRPHAGRRGPYG